MTYSFNLYEKAFIPCQMVSGGLAEYCLKEIFEITPNIRTIHADTPLETAALLRLLLAITHAALCGPKENKDWKQLWEEGCFPREPFNHYLKKHQGKFDLFDTQAPFYQRQTSQAQPKSIISLALEMCAGNNAVLFDHHTEMAETAFSASKAARALITAQTFGLGGLSGLPGQPFTDSPWGRGIVFFLEGKNLFETIMLNLLTRSQNPFQSSQNDAPYWEQNGEANTNTGPLGYLDYLTWQSRVILLTPEGDADNPVVRWMRWEPGRRLPGDGSLLDPLKRYKEVRNRGLLPIRFQEARSLWRDSAVLFNAVKAYAGFAGLNALAQAAELSSEGAFDDDMRFYLNAYGMANDKAKIEFIREERMPIPNGYLNPEKSDLLLEKLSEAINFTEDCAHGLLDSALAVANYLLRGREPENRNQRSDSMSLIEAWGVMRGYWGGLEPLFHRFMGDLGSSETALTWWKETVTSHTWRCYGQVEVSAGTDTKGLRASVEGNRRLAMNLHNNH